MNRIIFSYKNIIFVMIFHFLIGNIIAQENDISIITSAGSNKVVDQNEAKQIFFGKKSSWQSGNSIVIVDQSDSELGKMFYENFVKAPVSKVRVEWTKLVLSGQMSAPIKCNDDDAVKKEVAKNQNALGYISSKNLDKSVKEIFRIKL